MSVKYHLSSVWVGRRGRLQFVFHGLVGVAIILAAVWVPAILINLLPKLSVLAEEPWWVFPAFSTIILASFGVGLVGVAVIWAAWCNYEAWKRVPRWNK